MRNRAVAWAVLVVIISGALWLRASRLSALGFAEDEIDILHAISSYRDGDFSANAEHPMLAKLAAFAGDSAARRWNAAAAAHGWPGVPEETAVRLPAALAGAIMIPLVLFLLCRDWFGNDRVGLLAAAFWALDGQAIALNRSAKEDTFFAAFFLLAALLYARGKRRGREREGAGGASFTASGAAFGLMLACKYMPHYFGLHALYVRITDPAPGHNRPNARLFYLAMAAAFAVADFGLFSAASWQHLQLYFHGQTVSHTGYVFAQHIYVNAAAAMSAGVPPRFYLEFFVTRLPIAVLAAAAAGVAAIVRRPATRPAVFLRVFLVLILLPYSLIGVKFVRYVLPQLALIDVLAAIGVVWLADTVRRRAPAPAPVRGAIAFALAAAVVSAPLTAVLQARPYFSLSTNAVGDVMAPVGALAPDDEFNDAAVREAVMYVSGIAGPRATLASDAATVVEVYLSRAHRDDMAARSLSRDGLPTPLCETWVIAQDGHRYFENDALLAALAARPPAREWRVRGASAVRLYGPSSTRPCAARGGTLSASR